MKKVIEGSLYNTETAKRLGNYWNRLGNNDFKSLEETLYLTKSGKFFLYGEGGAMTRYAVWYGNTATGGVAIIPLTFNEAQEWAEKRLDGDEYEAIFGEVKEAGTDRVPKTITLSNAAIAELDKIKQQTGKNYGYILDNLILDAE